MYYLLGSICFLQTAKKPLKINFEHSYLFIQKQDFLSSEYSIHSRSRKILTWGVI